MTEQINEKESLEKVKNKKKYVVGGILLALGLIWALADGFQGGAVATVKKGHFSAYPNITVGEAFENYFGDTEWKSFKADGKKIVEFTGECSVYGEIADAKIQFVIEDDSFEIYHMSIDGENLSQVEIAAVLTKIMN